MPKSAFFVISTHLGGAERSLLDFFKGLTNEERKLPIVVVPKQSGPFIEELNQLSIEWQVLPLPFWLLNISRKKSFLSFLLIPFLFFYVPFYLLKIANFIKKNQIKKTHSTGLKFHLFLCLYSFFDRKTIFIIHLRDIIHSYLLKQFFYFFNNTKKRVYIANSLATAQSVPKLKTEVVYNGFNQKVYYPQTSNLKERLGIKKDHKLVGIIGVIAHWKGQMDFLSIAHEILKERQDIHFLIVGDEIYDTLGEKGELNKLKQRALKIDSKNIHFLGFQKNLPPVYSGLDALTHCSIRPEPFGRVIVEAMLCGCPVTASHVGGPVEIIKPQVNGLLHDMKDLSQLKANILRLIDDPSFAKTLAQKALKDSSKFALHLYIDKLKALVF